MDCNCIVIMTGQRLSSDPTDSELASMKKLAKAKKDVVKSERTFGKILPSEFEAFKNFYTKIIKKHMRSSKRLKRATAQQLAHDCETIKRVLGFKPQNTMWSSTPLKPYVHYRLSPEIHEQEEGSSFRGVIKSATLTNSNAVKKEQVEVEPVEVLQGVRSWGTGRDGLCPLSSKRRRSYDDPENVAQRGEVSDIKRIVVNKAGIKIEVKMTRPGKEFYKLEHWEVWGIPGATSAMKHYFTELTTKDFRRDFRRQEAREFVVAASGGRQPC